MSGQDAALEKAVKVALEFHPRISLAAVQIEVARVNGATVLRGEVNTLAEKRLAGLVAAQVPGAAPVRNLLRLRAVQPMRDSEIQARLWEELADDPNIDETLLEIEVRQRVVFLRGYAPSLVRKRLIGAIAWWVPGVGDVHNDIEVVPPESDSDEQIAEAIQIILDKDPLVDESEILVIVRDRRVRLHGAVDGEPEKNAAEFDCWTIEEVVDVINDLEIVPGQIPAHRHEFA